MSEPDVIVIHIHAGQAAEYERLFAERELPRWREYKARGAFISARIFRAAFGTDRRDDIAKYVTAVEVPSHAEHREHDAADRCCTPSDRHGAWASARVGYEAGDANRPPDFTAATGA
jgi:hypothetical protein